MNGFDQQPYPEESPQPTFWGRYGKWILIGGIVLVLVAVIAGGIWWFTGRPSPDEMQRQQQANQQIQTDLQACESAEDPERCRLQRAQDVAMEFGALEVCEELEGDRYDRCVWVYATRRLAPEACGEIQDEQQRVDCRDFVNSRLARESADVSYCDELSSEQAQQGCRERVSPTTVENCEQRGRSQEYCQGLATIRAAAEQQNADLCDQISLEELQVECSERVGISDRDQDGLDEIQEERFGTDDTNSDTDGDGLSDFEEVNTYGSDPTNPDTDGDGFSDGDEVDAGFSPTQAAASSS